MASSPAGPHEIPRPGVMAAVTPPSVAVHEAGAGAATDPLYPEEEATLARAVDKRRREFRLGRTCARRALAGLGVEPVALPVGPGRAPVWPPGVVGSITHCPGYAAAVAAHAADHAAVGIDAEVDEPLPPGVLEQVAGPQERRWLAQAPPGAAWDRLLFSIKESVYKAWYPLAGRWLGFHDALVDVDAGAARFRARLLVEGPRVGGRELTEVAGRFGRASGLVVAVSLVGPGG